eukprot:m.164546 g.164546  ORF g.164546 m.164546 type:complete len:433 (+) comp15240_c0_seq3:212-1510(+)
MFVSTLVLVAFALTLPTWAQTNCPILGCDPGRTFFLGENGAQEKLSMAWNISILGASSLQCIQANDEIVVCTILREKNPNHIPDVIGINATNGATLFTSDSLYNNPVYPSVLFQAQPSPYVLLVDEFTFAGVTFTGTPVGPPLNKVIGIARSPAVTSNGVIMFVRKNSTDLFGYLDSGVPHANIQLKGSISGDLAIVGNRAFVPICNNSHCFVCAVDVQRTLNNRLSIVYNSNIGAASTTSQGPLLVSVSTGSSGKLIDSVVFVANLAYNSSSQTRGIAAVNASSGELLYRIPIISSDGAQAIYPVHMATTQGAVWIAAQNSESAEIFRLVCGTKTLESIDKLASSTFFVPGPAFGIVNSKEPTVTAIIENKEQSSLSIASYDGNSLGTLLSETFLMKIFNETTCSQLLNFGHGHWLVSCGEYVFGLRSATE